MKAGKRWRLSLLGSGESLTDSIGLYSREVHAESIERHRDGRIGLANTGPSPSCSVKSQNYSPTHQVPLSYSFGFPQLRAPEVWMATGRGAETAPALKVHEIQNLFSSTSNIHSSLLGSYK